MGPPTVSALMVVAPLALRDPTLAEVVMRLYEFIKGIENVSNKNVVFVLLDIKAPDTLSWLFILALFVVMVLETTRFEKG
jgi:hypothetical protein